MMATRLSGATQLISCVTSLTFVVADRYRCRVPTLGDELQAFFAAQMDHMRQRNPYEIVDTRGASGKSRVNGLMNNKEKIC